MFAKRFRVDPDHFRLKDCDPAYPEVSDRQRAELQRVRGLLENEDE
jgi:hypothetical protein